MKKDYQIAYLGGDGIGPEIIAEGEKVLDTLAEIFSFRIHKLHLDWGSQYYLRHGVMFPENAKEILAGYDAMYLGAIGGLSGVPDQISGRMIPNMRALWDQYAGVRPVHLYPGVNTPLKTCDGKKIDFVVVRENTEGEYIEVGGSVHYDQDEVCVQSGVFTHKGCERIMRYAFELAKTRSQRHITSTPLVTNCTKSNAIKYSMNFWDKVFKEVAADYPDVSTNFNYVDAITMWLVKNPENFDVIVSSNMYGDIISDLASTMQGGLGFAASANLNMDGGLSMFEPMHGSAPKYAGKNVINPIATILSGKLMLEYLGEYEAASLLDRAVGEVLEKKIVRTRDMGGSTTTAQTGDLICAQLKVLS